MERFFKEDDKVIHIGTGESYYVTKVEEVYDLNRGVSNPTGRVECRRHELRDISDFEFFKDSELGKKLDLSDLFSE